MSSQLERINMNFNLEQNEAAFIIRVIGQLPTESGAFPLHQKLVAQYQAQEKTEPEKINHCFESAGSVVYPCYPEYLKKYSDADKMNVMLNKSCLNKRL